MNEDIYEVDDVEYFDFCKTLKPNCCVESR